MAREFMSRNVLTANRDDSVSRAVETMAENDVGSLVVLGSTGPCGMFTERDLLAKVIAANRDPQSTTISEALSPALPATQVGTAAVDVAAAMIRKKNRLVVFEGPDMVGIITATDIVRVIGNLESTFDIDNVVSNRLVSVPPEASVAAVAKEMHRRRVGSVIVKGGGGPLGIFTERDLLKKVLRPRTSLKSKVGDFMSSPLITAEYGARARGVARMMATNRIKRIPLYRESEMVGIVTARDLAQAFAAHA